MSKFASFVLFNVLMYLVYKGIDMIFTFFNLYSSPQFGHDLLTLPTSNDLWLVLANSVLSSAIAWYLLFMIKRRI